MLVREVYRRSLWQLRGVYLVAQADDTGDAVLACGRSAQAWQDADPELQPRLRRALARAEQLAKERGTGGAAPPSREPIMATVLKGLDVARSILDAIPATPLGAADLAATLVDAPLEKSGGVDVDAGELQGKVTFGIQAAARARVVAFNSADDVDEDGILGPAKPDAQPVVLFDPGQAWLKVRTEANARAAAGGTLDALGFELEAGAALVQGDYRVHSRDMAARAAVLADLGSPRFAVRLHDVRALAAGEALSLQLAGSLTASVSLAWSDIFAAGIGALAKLLPAGEILPIAIDAGLTVAADVKVSDEFLLVFSGVEAGRRWRVTLRKARARSAGLAAGLGVKATLKDPAQLEQALSPVLESLLGAPLERIKGILDKIVLAATLLPAETRIVEEAARRLGFSDGIETLPQVFAERVAQLTGRTRAAVAEAARSKIELGFHYEYQRVRQDSAVLQAVVDEATLAACHSDLIRGRIDGLLARAGETPVAATVELFLGQTTTRTDRAWGLSLGIGRWQLSGKDTKSLAATVDRDARGGSRVAYLGSRGYDWSFLGDRGTMAADFSAGMEGYSSRAPHTFSEYRFTLQLLWTEPISGFMVGRLRPQLDTALIWDVIAEGHVEQVAEALRPADGKNVEIAIQLRIGHGSLRRMLDGVADSGAPDPAEALAAALPYLDGLRGRTEIALRRLWYAPLWRAYLQDPGISASSLAATADRYFRRTLKEPGLALLEGQVAPGPRTVVGAVQLNPQLPDDVAAFQDGLRTWAEALSRDEPDNGLVPKIFDRLSGFWDRALYFRAAGVYLSDLARAAGVAADVERSLLVRWGDTGSLVISGAT